jgi:hypothetical protein
MSHAPMLVILSAARDLCWSAEKVEILRSAQNDRQEEESRQWQ